MTDMKVGDHVICVTGTKIGFCPQLNEVYEIAAIRADYISLKEFNCPNITFEWGREYFRSLTSQEEKLYHNEKEMLK